MPPLGMIGNHNMLGFIGELLELTLHEGGVICKALVWGLCSYGWER